jgi:esterase/lipase superfamily enzyme
MKREYHKWFSERLGRDMELLVFGHTGARTLVFPTRTGRFYDYENWGLVRALESKIEAGFIQLFCVDSVDAESLYNDWRLPWERIAHHVQYEGYILHEVLPFSQSRNPNPFLISHGCSLGAYHAVNLAFRHPDRVGKVVALSGRYDLTYGVGSFRGLFDGYYDDTIYYHTPSHFLPQLTDPEILDRLRRMEIVLAIGDQDAFYENNRQFSKTLNEKGVCHQLHVWHGEAHRPRYWRQMVALYL